MTIQEALRKHIISNKISPLDAEILLSLATNLPKEYILAHPEYELNKNQLRKFNAFIKRRASGEPIAYITGKKEFFGLDFSVNKNVLIPRPETELIVELVFKKIQDTRQRRGSLGAAKYRIPDTIVDVGTGSGNIIISIAKNISNEIRKKINFFALDISKDSLGVAETNARKYKINKKIKFAHSDLLNYFLKKKKINSKNIFIVANLPYVSNEIYKKNKSNLKFEPKSALLSSEKGLGHYMRLIKNINFIIKKCYVLHVTCFLEISPEQKPEVMAMIMKHLPNAKVQFFKDLAGKWRVAEIETET
jgi:release factor glutamine methyltransferase